MYAYCNICGQLVNKCKIYRQHERLIVLCACCSQHTSLHWYL